MAVEIEAQSPPSTYAIAAVIDGDPNAWGRVAYLTAIRAAMIWPGLRLAGIKGRDAMAGAAMGSAFITLLLLADYSFKRRPTKVVWAHLTTNRK